MTVINLSEHSAIASSFNGRPQATVFGPRNPPRRSRLRLAVKRRARHHGLTLFELLLALAIFLASLAALAQLLASGSRAAAQSKLQTEAILRCESKLGELVSGIEPIQSASKGSFDDDSRWSWQVTAADGPWPNLQLIELQVFHTGQSSLSSTSYTLRRYVRDPQLFVKPVVRGASTVPRQSGARTRNPPAIQPQTSVPTDAESEDSDG